MPTNPNKAFVNRCTGQYKPGSMMTGGQRYTIERQCREYDITLIALTTRALGFRKKLRDLTVVDAARCIAMASVWENYRRIGEEP